jgi:peptide chain release factor 3
MDEVEQNLTNGYPLSFPIGMGYDFQGIYKLNKTLTLFSGDRKNILKKQSLFSDKIRKKLSDKTRRHFT